MKQFSFCAAADLHIGMRFSGYPGVQKELIDARFTALQNIIDRAHEENCRLLIIAGDFFDRTNLPDRDLKRIIEIIKGYQGDCIALLPGNHDFYGGPGSPLWKKVRFEGPDNLLLLTEHTPVPLMDRYGLPVTLYPAPCGSRHSSENGLREIQAARQEEIPDEDVFRLGIAHGSIEGISPDMNKEYFPMTMNELEKAGMDLWIVGHTHINFNSSKVLIPGTPEPDGFDRKDEGAAWVIDVDEEKKSTPRRIQPGTFRFARLEKEIYTAADIKALEDELKRQQDSRVLVQLSLSGALEKKDFPLLASLSEEAKERFFYFSIDSDEVRQKITADVIEEEFREGSFPYQLLRRLAEGRDAEALQKAYEIIQELKT